MALQYAVLTNLIEVGHGCFLARRRARAPKTTSCEEMEGVVRTVEKR